MTDRNEALRLAEWIEDDMSCQGDAEVAAMLRQQAERIAELETERDQLKTDLHIATNDAAQMLASTQSLRAERDQLRAEVERLRADAERWEWIADGNNFDESFALLTDPKLTTYELTRAVDAARTTHKDEG